MKFNYKYIIILCCFFSLSFLPNSTLQAQVVVGDEVTPEDFSIVQIEGQAGMRLPKISDTDKITMKTLLQANVKATGLTIYNSTTGKIEFWDGNAWITLMDSISANNGLTHIGYSMKLGGDLVEPQTNINLNGFNFNHEQSVGGKFALNDTMVVVNNKVVDIRPSKQLVVNDTVISVEGRYLNFKPSEFSINNGALSVNSTSVVVDGKLNYTDNNQKSGYLLTSDSIGNAFWAPLRPLGAVVEGKLNNLSGFANTTKNITTESIKLPPGQWLIFAKYVGRMNARPDGMAHWILLSARPDGSSSFSEVTRNGANPEKKTVGYGYSYSTPSLLYYANITKDTEYRIYASTSNVSTSGDTTTDESWAGRSYFFAVRLDIPVY